jgi:hypothetical protein
MQVPITLPTESVCLGACSTDTVTRERMRVEMAGTGQGKDGDCSTVRGPPSTVAPRPIQQYVRWEGMVNTRWATTVAEWMGGAAHTWSAGRDAKQSRTHTSPKLGTTEKDANYDTRKTKGKGVLL